MIVCSRESIAVGKEARRNSAGFWDVSQCSPAQQAGGRFLLRPRIWRQEVPPNTASHLSCLGNPELPSAREWLLAPGSCKTWPTSPTQIAVVPSPIGACVLQAGDFLCNRGTGRARYRSSATLTCLRATTGQLIFLPFSVCPYLCPCTVTRLQTVDELNSIPGRGRSAVVASAYRLHFPQG